jgi:uncharacterized membrane protein YdjX (TVP38/TMEM64 family)
MVSSYCSLVCDIVPSGAFRPPLSHPLSVNVPEFQLFGHEIVAVLCGLVWGLWAGFGIVAAGTFLGEVGNF